MDDRLTEEQIQAEQERLNAIRDGTAGQKEYTKHAQDMADALKGLGKATIDYTKRMNDGATGAQEFNGTIDAISTGLQALTWAIAALAGPLGLLARAVVGATVMIIKGAAEYSKAAAKQADELFKTYQDLNKVGAAGAGGMQEVFNNMQKFGYNLKELDKMTALIAENSKQLSALGGTAAQGTKKFAELSDAMTKGEIGKEFKRAGLSIDDINQSSAVYLRTITSLGLQRKKSDLDLISGARSLTNEFDTLRRVTGETLTEQARKQAAIVGEDVSGAVLARLMAGTEQAQKNAGVLSNVLQMLPEEMSAMQRRSLGGRVTPEDAAILRSLPQTTKILQQLARGRDVGMTDAEIMEMSRQEAETALQRADRSYELGIGQQLTGYTRETLAKIAGREDYRDAMAAARDEKRGDQQVRNMVDMQDAQRQSTQSLQSFVNAGVGPATTALKLLAEAANAVYGVPGKIMPKTFGSQAQPFVPGTTPGGSYDSLKGGPKPSGPATGTQMVGGADARSKAESYLGRKMSDQEYSAIIKLTHAEATAGHKADQREQALIMGTILNRARTHPGGVMGAINQPNQFQPATGTKFKPGPNQAYMQGPGKDRQAMIEGATAFLDGVSKQQTKFTAANPGAYGPGTNIGYLRQLQREGGEVYGGTIFNTKLDAVADKLQARTATDSKKEKDTLITTPDLSGLGGNAFDRRLKELGRPTVPAGPSTEYKSKLGAVKPDAAAPVKPEMPPTETANNASNQMFDLMKQQQSTLELMARYQQQTATNTHKISKAAS
jgi:hypothetical protein